MLFHFVLCIIVTPDILVWSLCHSVGSLNYLVVRHCGTCYRKTADVSLLLWLFI